MNYCLINYTTGEVYTVKGAISAQFLYKRALSHRRFCIYRGYSQDYMRLYAFNDGEAHFSGRVVEEWQGGQFTPIEDMGLCVRAYYALLRRGCKTAEQVARYVYEKDIDRRLPDKVQYQVAEVLDAYDHEAACHLRKKLNLRHYKKTAL